MSALFSRTWFAGRLCLALVLTAGSSARPLIGDAAADEMMPNHNQIVIENFMFYPPLLTVRVGDTIEWINRDFAPHTATDSNRVFDTGKMNREESASFVAKTPGRFSYICRYHPDMKGTLVIQDRTAAQ